MRTCDTESQNSPASTLKVSANTSLAQQSCADDSCCSLCKNTDLGDFNFDGLLNVLDITILVNELLYLSNQYCIYLYGDFDNNQDLNVLDVIQFVNLILWGKLHY